MGKRTSQLTQLTAAQVAQGDYLPIVDASAGQTKYITVKDLTGAPDFGWQATGESWAYSSWTAGTRIGVITVPTDATVKYNPGMRVRFSQTTGGTKYGIIHAVSATTLTIFFPAGTTLNNEAITSPVYSGLATPVGFDKDPILWTLETSSVALLIQASPVTNTWYNVGGISLTLGIGAWHLRYSVEVYTSSGAGGAKKHSATLSTANNTESDLTMSRSQESSLASTDLGTPVEGYRPKKIASPTTYYLNARTQASANNLYLLGDRSLCSINATSGYL